MKGVERRNHPQLVRAKMIVRVSARQLERGLVRFCAGIAEKHAIGERRIDELLCQPQRRLVGHPIGHVPDGVRLVG